ncbi:hypothetical protein GCM10028793_31380 [Nocardiopsis oceani]
MQIPNDTTKAPMGSRIPPTTIAGSSLVALVSISVLTRRDTGKTDPPIQYQYRGGRTPGSELSVPWCAVAEGWACPGGCCRYCCCG